MACPQCDMDNEFHNGLEYECPDCDHVWDDGINLFDQEDFDEEEEDENEY